MYSMVVHSLSNLQHQYQLPLPEKDSEAWDDRQLAQILKQVSGSPRLLTQAVSSNAFSRIVNAEEEVQNLIFVDHLTYNECSVW